MKAKELIVQPAAIGPARYYSGANAECKVKRAIKFKRQKRKLLTTTFLFCILHQSFELM